MSNFLSGENKLFFVDDKNKIVFFVSVVKKRVENDCWKEIKFLGENKVFFFQVTKNLLILGGKEGLLTKKSSVKNVSLGDKNKSDYFQVKTKCFFQVAKVL